MHTTTASHRLLAQAHTNRYAPLCIKGLLSIAMTGCLSLTFLTPAMAADFSGSLKGVSITDAQAANKPPSAAFTYIVNGETVTFDASGSSDSDGSIIEYKWDLGDGSIGTGKNFTYSYTNYGIYTATLTIIDNGKAVTLLQKQITYGAPTQLIGTSVVGANEMGNNPNYVYFHRLNGLPSTNGKLSKYRVTIAATSTSTRSINIALYTNDATSNRPKEFITGSECGWISYAQASGEIFECEPIGTINITSGMQYWIGIRGKEYGGIRGDSSSGVYYGSYLGENSTWNNIENLPTLTSKAGTAGILQIEAVQ